MLYTVEICFSFFFWGWDRRWLWRYFALLVYEYRSAKQKWCWVCFLSVIAGRFMTQWRWQSGRLRKTKSGVRYQVWQTLRGQKKKKKKADGWEGTKREKMIPILFTEGMMAMWCLFTSYCVALLRLCVCAFVVFFVWLWEWEYRLALSLLSSPSPSPPPPPLPDCPAVDWVNLVCCVMKLCFLPFLPFSSQVLVFALKFVHTLLSQPTE